MSDAHTLHFSLLRPAILHILRASGFHSTRPSVLDTLTDLCARHLLLVAERTAGFVYERTSNDGYPAALSNTLSLIATNEKEAEAEAEAEAANGHVEDELAIDNEPEVVVQAQTRIDAYTPTLTDIRQALESVHVFTPTLTAAEESWKEVLRRPLKSYPEGAAREKERQRRDAEDTRDIRDFIDWCTGPQNREIRRIANVLGDESRSLASLDNLNTTTATSATAAGNTSTVPATQKTGPEGELGGSIPSRGGDIDVPTTANMQRGLVDGMLSTGRIAKDDYLTVLKKKHSKTGDGARYAGTVLGKLNEEKSSSRIEGGPETLKAWAVSVKRKRDEDQAGDGE